jgi:glycerol-3-phosphate dehydrogenase
MCLANGGEEIFPALEDICRAELGWDTRQWQDELKRYQDIWQRFYYSPK